MSFNVLIATINRPSLRVMLHSLENELCEEDVLTVVFDGHKQVPRTDFSKFKCRIQTYCEPVALGGSGHGIRTKQGKLLDKTTWVMHADDDDVYVAGTFHKLRALCTDPNQLYIAKIMDWNQNVLPKKNEIIQDHIGTPCGIIPWQLNSEGNWPMHHGGDQNFQLELTNLSKPVFLDWIMQIVRPKEIQKHESCLLSYSKTQEDLHKAFGIDLQKLWDHWNNHGKREKRTLCNCNESYTVPSNYTYDDFFKIQVCWFGPALTPNRIKNLELLRSKTEVPVELVTNENLAQFIHKDYPFHKGFPYLSATQKSDQIRTYFMHTRGGAQSDIKDTVASWKPCFEKLWKSKNLWMMGYSERGPGDIAYKPASKLQNRLVGNGAMICKPFSPLTQMWFDEVHKFLDSKLLLLQKFPAKLPNDHKELPGSKYPIEWNELQGRIFHRILPLFQNSFSNELPTLVFTNYR